MRKYVTIFLIYILITSIVNEVNYKSVSLSNSEIGFEGFNNNLTFNSINKRQIIHNLDKIDGHFTENCGQISNDSVKYYIQGKGVWFLDDGVVFEIKEEISINSRESRVESRESKVPFDPLIKLKPQESPMYKSVIFRLNFKGANRVFPEGQGLLQHRSNFFYGNDSSKWCTNVPNFQEIVYENIYDNIDLRYYTTIRGLKYDFIIHSGGNPNNIKIRINGLQDLLIDNLGNIRVKSPFINFIDSKPFIYQNRNGIKEISGGFRILENNIYGFVINDIYDGDMDLIIDPLIYSTFIGGSYDDWSYRIEVDTMGNAYIAGWTKSHNFPNTTGAYNNTHNGGDDVFVLKLNPTGSALSYSTYIGGNSYDGARDIVIDDKGNVYITGYTNSSDFPNTTNVFDTSQNGDYDCFVLKLNPTGSALIYSTFVGGKDNDVGMSLIMDISNNIYVTGSTLSSDFPNTTNAYDTSFNGGSDVFVLKLNSLGSILIYSTFVGGINKDRSFGIVIDSNYNSYVTGETYSPDFPNTTGAYDISYNGGRSDVFVFKLNLTMSSLIYSTFVGGNDVDYGADIEIDSNNNVYLTGETESLNFPNTTGAYDISYNKNMDGFVFKLSSNGSSLLYSTFIGGTGWDYTDGIAIDSKNNIYVTGGTTSTDFPITTNPYDNTYNGNRDVFVVKLNSTGSSILYSTFVGGSNDDESIGLTIDSNNNVYVTGLTKSFDFPNTTISYDATLNGGNDVFVFKLNLNLNYSIPSVIDLKISEQTILRNNSIYLYSNATDTDDLEKNLTPFFEYRDQNEQIWNKTYFLNLKYNNARWEVSFTPSKNAILGLYDFRVMFNDTEMLFTSWLYLNNSLTVLNNIPFIENLSLSKNEAIFGDIISIWINNTDVEEQEENLTVILEYKTPDEQSWDTTYLDNPRFVNKKWQYNFSIPFDAPFGYYDFRVRCNDSDGNFSSWYYLNDSLLVYNLNPNVIDLKLSVNSVYRTKSLSLFVNGTDHETPEGMLNLYSQVKSKFDYNWINLSGKYLQNFWQLEISTEKNSTLGFLDFRVRFEDNESKSSEWFYLNDSLEILNNLPIISDDLDDIIVGFQPIMLDLSAFESDIEDFNENLNWKIPQQEYSYLKSISLIDSNNDTLKIVPLENASGSEDIEFILLDKDNGITSKSDITIIIDSKISELTPKVTLLSPIDKTTVNAMRPTLKWTLDYTGTESINYKIILDDNPGPVEELKNDLTTTEYTIETDLENGKTYSWTVVPQFGENTGVCLSGVWSFTVNISVPIPSITLIYPLDNAILKTLKPTLSWILNYNGAETVKYDLYLDNNPNPQEKLPDITQTSYTPTEDLETGKTYYWKIIPKTDLVIGKESEIRSFSIEIEEKPSFDLNLSLSANIIELKPGENKTIKASVTNLATVKDEIELKLNYSITSGINAHIVGLKSVEIGSNEIHEFAIVIFNDGNLKLKDILITITAKSNKALDYELIVEKSEILTVKILDITKPKDVTDDNFLIILSIAIIVVIIVILLMVFLLMKRKKEVPPGEPLEEPPEIPPETEPIQEPTILKPTDELPPDTNTQLEQPQQQVKEQPSPHGATVEAPQPTVVTPPPTLTTQSQPLTTPCPLCQQQIPENSDPCPQCGGVREWGKKAELVFIKNNKQAHGDSVNILTGYTTFLG